MSLVTTGPGNTSILRKNNTIHIEWRMVMADHILHKTLRLKVNANHKIQHINTKKTQ